MFMDAVLTISHQRIRQSALWPEVTILGGTQAVNSKGLKQIKLLQKFSASMTLLMQPGSGQAEKDSESSKVDCTAPEKKLWDTAGEVDEEETKGLLEALQYLHEYQAKDRWPENPFGNIGSGAVGKAGILNEFFASVFTQEDKRNHPYQCLK